MEDLNRHAVLRFGLDGSNVTPGLSPWQKKPVPLASAVIIATIFWPAQAYAACTATAGPSTTDYVISNPFGPPLGPPTETLDTGCAGATGDQSVEVPVGVIFDRFNAVDGILSDGSAATWTLINNGAVRASNNVIVLDGGGHTLINNGEISGSTIISVGQVVGMDGDGMIVNSGTGTISGGLDGIVVGGALDLDNAGSIAATRKAIVAGSGSTILNRASGTISGESGIIVSGMLSVDNYGSIQASDKAILVSGALNLENDGAISATGSAVTGGAGSVVTNGADGQISGATGVAGAGAIMLDNAGDITATDTAVAAAAGSTITNRAGGLISGTTAAVRITGGGTVINEAGATISSTTSGGIPGFGAVVVTGGSGTVVNAGTISAPDYAIVFWFGSSGTLELHPGSVINGRVIALTSTSTLRFGGSGSDSFDMSKFGSQFQLRSLEKTGDSVWTMTGAYGGATNWTLADGTLSVANAGALGASGSLTYLGGVLDLQDGAVVAHNLNLHDELAMDLGVGITGSLTGAISETGGSFGLAKTGEGTLILSGNSGYTGDTTITGGTLANNGTLSSNVFVDGATYMGTGTSGSVVANSGSVITPGNNSIGTLNVSGDFAFNDGSTYEVEIAPDGSSDLIAATGAVTISGTGTTMAIMGNPADIFPPIGEFKIVTADGGVTGQFETVTDNLPDIDFETVYNGNDVRLTYVAGNVFSPKEVHPAAMIAGLDVSRLYTTTLREHVGGLAAGSWLPDDETLRGREHWFAAFGSGTSVDASGATIGWNGATGGVAFGMNGMFDMQGRAVFAGASAGYSETSVDAGVSGSTGIRSFHAGLDAAAGYGPWLLSGALGIAYQDYDFSRVVPYGGGTVLAESSAEGIAVTASGRAFLNLAERYSDAPDYHLGPYASLDVVHAMRGGFTETGAGILNLTVDPDSATQFVTGVGLSAGGTVTLGDREVELDLLAGWEHVFGDARVTTSSAIPVADLDFSTQSAPVSRDRLSIGLSATYAISERVSATLGYGAKISQNDSSHRGSVRLSVRF